MRAILLKASKNPWLAAQARRRKFVRRAVCRFMPGETLDEAFGAVGALAERGIPAVLTQLGENVGSAADVSRVVDHYRSVMDRSVHGEFDVHISVKPTQLGLDLGAGVCARAMARLSDHARGVGVPLWIDMEESSYVEPTLELYRSLLTPGAALGICLQAYLHRTPEDLEDILGAGGTVRLVKGAYREPAEISLQGKGPVDQAFLNLARRLSRDLEGTSTTRPLLHVLGSHDIDLLAEVPDGPEIQMLYGIRTKCWADVQAAGTPFRVLISYGEQWYPWYMRRLAERPANLGFLLRSLVPGGG